MVKRENKFFDKKSVPSSLSWTVLYPALVGNDFAEHLRKAWSQWQITKYPIEVVGGENDVAIRTREDFQEDIKFLCTSETVSTHRGVGVITMVCYPVVLEVFKTDGTKEMYGFIIMSDTKSKNFDTVKHFEEKCIQFIRNLGYNIVRYHRMVAALNFGAMARTTIWSTCRRSRHLFNQFPSL